MENIISVSKLKSGDLLEQLRFQWFADRKAFINAFAKIGVKVDKESDLAKLVDLNKSGGDLSGVLKNPKDGSKIIFSVVQISNDIDIRHHVLDRNEHQMKLVA